MKTVIINCDKCGKEPEHDYELTDVAIKHDEFIAQLCEDCLEKMIKYITVFSRKQEKPF